MKRGYWSAMLALLLLGACGKGTGGSVGNDTDTSTDSVSAPETDGSEPSGEKLNGYVEGYNTLISTFGLPAVYRLYLGQNIQRKGVNDSFFINPGWLDNALGELKKAQAASGPGGELDKAGAQIVPVLDRLVGRLKGLNTYYSSRAYIEDNLARGKREDPEVIVDFKTAIGAMDRLSNAIDAVQDRRDAAELAGLKKQGDMVGYDGGLALLKSKALVNLFDGADSIRDPAKLQRGDALIAEIEQALADTRSELAKTKGAADVENGLRNSMYDTVVDRLTGMVGQYRGMRRSGSSAEYQMMVSSYNDAIDHANLSN